MITDDQLEEANEILDDFYSKDGLGLTEEELELGRQLPSDLFNEVTEPWLTQSK